MNIKKQAIPFVKWLSIGVLIEIIIFSYCYFTQEEINEVFRYAARYSGRVSWLFYLLIFYFFATTYSIQDSLILNNLRKLVSVFCIMHLIHFGFLATNIQLNNIELVPIKLLGGALGYLLIISFPIFFNQIKKNALRLVYFYYLGIVIAVTYLARINGDFQGADPGLIHYVGLGSVLMSFILFSILIFTQRKSG